MKKKFLSILLVLLLLGSIGMTQDKEQVAVAPIAAFKNISEDERRIAFNIFQDSLSTYYSLISQDEFDRARKEAFKVLDVQTCTVEQCIRQIMEFLQVEQQFTLQLIREADVTQLSLRVDTPEDHRVKSEFCEGCDLTKMKEAINNLIAQLLPEHTLLALVEQSVENHVGNSTQAGLQVQNFVDAYGEKNLQALEASPRGEYNLGRIYLKGYGVEANERIAHYWIERAADHNHEAAQNALGYMYQKGLGIDEDEEQAVVWYRKAADQGYAMAQFNLGSMYLKGYGGLEESEEEAKKWYGMAAKKGNKFARKALEKMGGVLDILN
ncbi:MAG: sel1 repeat family protein [SAR324 cluster bacterium]|nr:sel1 repeat family protein [SAR324 cluster bacterium]